MKKLFLLIVILLVSLPASLFAKDQWGVGVSLGSPTALNIFFPAGPISFDLDIGGGGYNAVNQTVEFGVITLDLLFWEPKLSANSNHRFFMGIGPRFSISQKYYDYSWSRYLTSYIASYWGAGVRMVLGFDFQPLEHFSIFIKGAPSIGVLLSKNSSKYSGMSFTFDLGLGFRYVTPAQKGELI